VVCDEPLYAHYLAVTGIEHPGAAEVVEHHETDWKKVAAGLTGPLPAGKTIFFQKHMAHHLLSEIGRDWLEALTHCFLIRDPHEMLTSLIQQLPEPTLADTGLPQQLELFAWAHDRTGTIPPVLDARDVLDDPERLLRLLCEAVGVPFDARMLEWEPGPRPTDGVWGKHWYGAVERSTGFRPYAPKLEELPDRLRKLHAHCVGYYRRMHHHRLGR
ncbi:MAG: HAD family hydrolase, partial [Acidobacteriota bacterium]|nr:HAD family hydrolase [Acidobacteriota bacterium]